jgi:adenylosuccinate lyase
MESTALTAISPIDGRYHRQVHHLGEYFSEYALIKYRVLVEVEYYLFLAEKKFFSVSAKAARQLRDMAGNFSLADAEEIKATERITNHDVKAVEYFIKSRLDSMGLEQEKEWVHFGLTSQDVNNTAIPLLWKHAIEF